MICQLLSTIKLASLFSQFSVVIVDNFTIIVMNIGQLINYKCQYYYHRSHPTLQTPVNYVNYVNFVNFDIVDSIIDYNLTIVDS